MALLALLTPQVCLICGEQVQALALTEPILVRLHGKMAYRRVCAENPLVLETGLRK